MFPEHPYPPANLLLPLFPSTFHHMDISWAPTVQQWIPLGLTPWQPSRRWYSAVRPAPLLHAGPCSNVTFSEKPSLSTISSQLLLPSSTRSSDLVLFFFVELLTTWCDICLSLTGKRHMGWEHWTERTHSVGTWWRKEVIIGVCTWGSVSTQKGVNSALAGSGKDDSWSNSSANSCQMTVLMDEQFKLDKSLSGLGLQLSSPATPSLSHLTCSLF